MRDFISIFVGLLLGVVVGMNIAEKRSAASVERWSKVASDAQSVAIKFQSVAKDWERASNSFEKTATNAMRMLAECQAWNGGMVPIHPTNVIDKEFYIAVTNKITIQ